jgi:hypothetical protein
METSKERILMKQIREAAREMACLNGNRTMLDCQKHNIFWIALPSNNSFLYRQRSSRPHSLSHGHAGALGTDACQCHAIGGYNAPGNRYPGTVLGNQGPERDFGNKTVV